MTPSDDVVIQWITRGQGFLRQGSNRIDLELGRPQLWPQTGAAFSLDDYDQSTVHINRRSLEEVAVERGHVTSGLLLDHTVRPDDRAVQTWRNTVQLISYTVLDRGASPLLQAEMSRLGALTLLELYPVATSTLPPDLLIPRNAHLRQAVEYVHANAHLPITSTDLAQIGALSLRALQLAFQKHFGLSPNGYLRQVRLDRVRDQLSAGDPATTYVIDVARHWGFAHAGRFSAAYAHRILVPFLRAIPDEIEEAAFIDGCSRFGFFWRMVVPLAMPGVVTTGILAFIASWNSYLLPLFILNDSDTFTLPLGVQAFSSEYSVDTARVLAFTALSMIPALIFFSVFERRIVGGLTGAVKG